jgi:HAD superfamily hydrolase (TIGR01509 family)
MSNSIEDKYQRLLAMTEGKYEAFLYDCDGTLADNMNLHKEAYAQTAARYGIRLDTSIIIELAGWPTVNVSAEISRRYGVAFDAMRFAEEKSALYYDSFIGQTQPIEFVTRHLQEHAGKVHIGIVSGGRPRTVKKTLEVLGLLQYVEVIVGAGDTLRGKPFPDPFLSAAALLHVDPARCMVFEDGQPGVDAAIAAGMDWVRIDQI